MKLNPKITFVVLGFFMPDVSAGGFIHTSFNDLTIRFCGLLKEMLHTGVTVNLGLTCVDLIT